MENKQLIGVLLIISTLVVGTSAYLIINMPPTQQQNNGTTTETSVTTTTGGSTYQIIFRDQDLLEYNISMPDTTMLLLNGTERVISDYRGKWVLIEFFSTWCSACEYFVMALGKFYDNWKQNVTVISLTVNLGDTIEKLQQYVVDHKVNWTMGQDIGDNWKNTSADFIGVRYIPTPIIIDPSGRLRYMHEGTLRYVEMCDIFHELMAKTPF